GVAWPQPDPPPDDQAEPGDLGHGEANEDDARLEHLDAERDVRGRDEPPRQKRGPYDAEIERHLAIVSNRVIVSSYTPNKSFALSEPPTVKGTITEGIFARSASHSAARGSLYAARTTAFAGSRLSWSSNSPRCAVLGGRPGFGSSETI